MRRKNMTVLLFSGGNDSTLLLHFAARRMELDAVLHCDTGIGISETQDFVRHAASELDAPLYVYKAAENQRADGTLEPMVYEDLVMKHGFPGPSAHRLMFIKLKQRSLERFKRDHCPTSGITYITGARRDESARRKINVTGEYQQRKRTLWHNPLWNWDAQDMERYRKIYNVPLNPVSERLGMSGECLCGAYAKPGELARIGKHYPAAAERIQKLEKRFANHCEAIGMPSWGWEGKPPRWWQEHKRGQQALFSEQIMCSGCAIKGRSS